MAAALPEETAAAVWNQLASLRGRFTDVRWLRPELLHLTLVFLGQTEPERVPAISASVATVAHAHAAYRTTVSGGGGHVANGRSSRRGGVAWLTLGDGFKETAALSLAIDATLGSATYDEHRRPRPHLTVARNIDVQALTALRDAAAEMTLVWRTSRIVLFRSHLGQGGSRYEPLMTRELRG